MTMKLKTTALALLIPAIFVLGIQGAKTAGLWVTEDSKEPARYADASIDAYDPQSISGATTLAEICAYFEIPEAILTQAFALDPEVDLTTFKTKDLSTYYAPMDIEVGNEAVQSFVALYLNLPYELIDVYLPLQAYEVLKANHVSLTPEQIAYLESHTVQVRKSEGTTVTTESEETSPISGPTTIQQVLDLGMTLAEFEQIVGFPVDFTNRTVKDFCIEKGLSFGDIKTQLTEALKP